MLEIHTILEDDKENNLSSTMQGDSDLQFKQSSLSKSSDVSTKHEDKLRKSHTSSSILTENFTVTNV